jgi:hypothetical protein
MNIKILHTGVQSSSFITKFCRTTVPFFNVQVMQASQPCKKSTGEKLYKKEEKKYDQLPP